MKNKKHDGILANDLNKVQSGDAATLQHVSSRPSSKSTGKKMEKLLPHISASCIYAQVGLIRSSQARHHEHSNHAHASPPFREALSSASPAVYVDRTPH